MLPTEQVMTNLALSVMAELDQNLPVFYSSTFRVAVLLGQHPVSLVDKYFRKDSHTPASVPPTYPGAEPSPVPSPHKWHLVLCSVLDSVRIAVTVCIVPCEVSQPPPLTHWGLWGTNGRGFV